MMMPMEEETDTEVGEEMAKRFRRSTGATDKHISGMYISTCISRYMGVDVVY